MNVTLTGAAGHLGARVCRALIAAGHDVRATDKKERADSPVRIDVADLLDRNACYRLVTGAAAVVHLGNHPNDRSGDAQRVFNENAAMNMNVFQAAVECGVKRIVFASSVQAFSGRLMPGETGTIPAYLPLDGNAPLHPHTAYALSKAVGEMTLAHFARCAGVSGVAIRFPGIAHELCAHDIMPVYANDAGRFDEAFAFLHVDDAATLVPAVLAADLPGFRTYFPVARGSVIGKTAADVIREYYPTVPLRKPAEAMEALVDLSAIERETGWTPCTLIHRKLLPAQQQ